MRSWRKSLSIRLTALYAGMFCFSVTLLGAAYYWVSVHEPRHALKMLAERDFLAMKQIDDATGRAQLVTTLRNRAKTVGRRQHFHALIDPSGHAVTANLPSWPTRSPSRWLELEADVFLEGVEIDHYAILRDGRLDDGSRLLTGWDADEVLAREEQLQEAAAWLIGGSIVLGVFGALLMTAAITKRLDAINRAAMTVMEGDLSQRVLLKGTGDEFDRLAETLNLMLSRIEALFEAVRRVSDSAAHELRTPLTRLMGHLDRIDPDLVGSMPGRGSLLAAKQEAERLNRIIDATLRISRIEGRRYEARMVQVNLRTLAEDVCDYYTPEAERRAIIIHCIGVGEAIVTADVDLMFQAVTNLVDNAIKFSPPQGRVTVVSGADAWGTFLAVLDSGPGLASGEANLLTERFFRGSASRNTSGEGLGLTLVAAIAKWHDCQLTFTNEPHGFKAELRWTQTDKS